MGNAMQFSLGLAAGSFLSTLGAAQRGVTGLIGAGLRLPVLGAAVGGLIGSFTSLHSVIENTFGAITKGAELNALHKRSGESVSDLFKMEKGFKAARVPAESLGSMLFFLQKSLGGFNEMGEPTKDIFEGIGLSVESLKKQKAPEQLEAIFKGLAKLNNSEAATAAGKIFGRGGAGDALQLARSGSQFSDAMKGAAEGAALFARNAEAFERIELSIGRLKAKFNSIFANLAEGAAPGIQAMLDKLNGIDLTQLGQRVGKMMTLVVNSWKAANFGELVGLSLQAGFEKAINWLFRALKAVAAALPELWAGSKLGLHAAADLGVAQLHDLAAAQIRQRAQGYRPGSEEETAAMEHAKMESDLAAQFRKAAFREVNASIAAVGRGVNDAIGADKSNVIEETASKQLRDRLNNIFLKGTEEAGFGKGGISALGAGLGKGKPSEANALERVGGMFFRAGGGSRLDYTQETARNTAKTNTLLSEWLHKTYTDSFGGKHNLSLNLPNLR